MIPHHLPRFDRQFFDSSEEFTVIGDGFLGGKAQGLADIRNVLTTQLDAGAFPGVVITIPRMVVVATDVFDRFLSENEFDLEALCALPDHAIARAFQKGSLGGALAGDLKALISKVHTPLAVRSSSLLEDAMYQPFAGVYATKMIPNNQFDPDIRFRKLTEAVKMVWASTYFSEARSYVAATDRGIDQEKMAVIIQEVVGRKHEDRFYPDVSGVARSYNFYPLGHARPREGVVSLALGLGKTIVDGGRSWTYSPAFPRSLPPYNTLRDLMQQSQTRFWAVNMGPAPEYDPIKETEFLVLDDLEVAERDEVLGMVASTYEGQSDRLVSRVDVPGPRVLTFAPLLVAERLPVNRAITSLLSCCEHALGTEVEIEFAMTFSETGERSARLGFLQVRPMVVSQDVVDVPAGLLKSPEAVVASESALGNGVVESIRDVVFLDPEVFDTSHTMTMATQVEAINRQLASEGRPYLLIGFGRWGTSDPWLGIPVQWGQISGAKVIVESSLPDVQTDPSQGSHFFHNVTSFRVLYFTVKHTGPYTIDWDWLRGQEQVSRTEFLRHVRLPEPLLVAVDGKSGRGVVLRPGAALQT